MPSKEREELARRYNRGGTVGRNGALQKKASKARSRSQSRKNDLLVVGTLFTVLAAIIGGYFYYERSMLPDYEDVSDNTVNPGGADTRKSAPDFSLGDASGTTISLQGHRGKVVVLHFLQVLSNCQGTYYYKSDDRAGYDPALGGYISLTDIGTIHQFEELRTIYNSFPADKVELFSIIVPPSCCGDPFQFSQDFKNNYTLTWHVASDTLQYDTWYKYMDYLPSDSNKVFTRDPTILVLDREMKVAYDSGYSDSATLSSRINSEL